MTPGSDIIQGNEGSVPQTSIAAAPTTSSSEITAKASSKMDDAIHAAVGREAWNQVSDDDFFVLSLGIIAWELRICRMALYGGPMS